MEDLKLKVKELEQQVATLEQRVTVLERQAGCGRNGIQISGSDVDY